MPLPSIVLSTPHLPPRARRSRLLAPIAVLVPLLLALALTGCQIPDPFVASYSSSSGASAAVRWPTFTDRGNDGWTMSYPPDWQPAYVNSPVNDDLFTHKATGTALEILVTTVSQSPADVLAQDTPPSAAQAQQHIVVTQRTIADHPAVDVYIPYALVPTPVHRMPNSGAPAITGGRTIVMVAKNSAGTTNVYTFIVRYAVNEMATVVPQSLADNPALDAMLSTFQLPATIDPVAAHP